MPGVGFPKWNIELLKVRNGKPGSWELEWRNGSFKHAYPTVIITEVKKRKTG
jgi:protein ImuA